MTRPGKRAVQMGRGAVAALVVALFVTGPFAAIRPAGAAEGISVAATIDGRSLEDVDSNDPIVLTPDEQVEIKVEVTNESGEDITVESIRMAGEVAGLTFFNFTTRVDLDVADGETGDRVFRLDMYDLASQATGLLPAHIDVLDPDRDVLASQGFAADVKGKITSVYGIFGLLVLLISALILAALLVRLASHRLPANRVRRASRFAVPGIGIGLVLTFTLSALRVLLPAPGAWLTFIVVGGIVGFVAGYLTPAPDYYDEDEDEDLDELDEYLEEQRETLAAAATRAGTAVAGPGSASGGTTNVGGAPPAPPSAPAGPVSHGGAVVSGPAPSGGGKPAPAISYGGTVPGPGASGGDTLPPKGGEPSSPADPNATVVRGGGGPAPVSGGGETIGGSGGVDPKDTIVRGPNPPAGDTGNDTIVPGQGPRPAEDREGDSTIVKPSNPPQPPA